MSLRTHPAYKLTRDAHPGTLLQALTFHKRHGLKSLRLCLSSVLNLKEDVPGGVAPGIFKHDADVIH